MTISFGALVLITFFFCLASLFFQALKIRQERIDDEKVKKLRFLANEIVIKRELLDDNGEEISKGLVQSIAKEGLSSYLISVFYQGCKVMMKVTDTWQILSCTSTTAKVEKLSTIEKFLFVTSVVFTIILTILLVIAAVVMLM